MGIYDRQYARDDQPGLQLSAPQSMTMRLIVVTACVYVLQFLIPAVNQWGALRVDWFRQPWMAFQLLTYGFLHDVGYGAGEGLLLKFHFPVNMFVLWMFGREVEHRYGSRAFLAFYLTAIVVAGVAWSMFQALSAAPASLIGASGGVAGIVALFALNFPHRRILFMFAIPMPMWVAAILLLVLDLNHAMDASGRVAGTAHLAGAGFGLGYFLYGFNPGLWVWDRLAGMAPSRKPKLRVHQPDYGDDDEDPMNQEVDDILRKIKSQGQDSLTRRERRLLEKASRQYQQRK